MLFIKNKIFKSKSQVHFWALLSVIFCFCFSHDSNAAMNGTNRAVVVLCDVILLIRGRFGRAIALIAIMTTSWGFILGKSDWKKVVTLVVGFGLLFSAEGFAYIILPSKINGISGMTGDGTIFNPKKSYSPEEIVRHVCPELSRF